MGQVVGMIGEPEVIERKEGHEWQAARRVDALPRGRIRALGHCDVVERAVLIELGVVVGARRRTLIERELADEPPQPGTRHPNDLRSRGTDRLSGHGVQTGRQARRALQDDVAITHRCVPDEVEIQVNDRASVSQGVSDDIQARIEAHPRREASAERRRRRDSVALDREPGAAGGGRRRHLRTVTASSTLQDVENRPQSVDGVRVEAREDELRKSLAGIDLDGENALRLWRSVLGRQELKGEGLGLSVDALGQHERSEQPEHREKQRGHGDLLHYLYYPPDAYHESNHDTELAIVGSTARSPARITAGSIVVAKSSLRAPRSRGAFFRLRVWAALTPLAVAGPRRLVRISNCGWVWIRGEVRWSRVVAGNVP